MNIKQVLAGSLAAITAGATMLIAGISATSTLGDYVVTSDGSLTSPVIVVGDTAAVEDVLSAIDIGVATAGYATTLAEVAGSTTVGVNNGALVDTSSTKLYLADLLTKTGVKTTVTKADLPALLASSTFADDNGIAYNFDQYISWGAGTISFGNSGGDLDDPAMYIDTGTSTAAPLFNYFVTFNKPLNISSTNVIGNSIDLLGTKYTIGSGSSFDGTTNKLILFGSSNTQLMSEGEEQTISVNSIEHNVKLLGVSSSTVAVVSVDGESKEVTQGSSYTIASVDVYVDSVFYYPKEAQTSQAKLSFGSSKLTLENGQAVKTGTSEDTIEGTWVTLTGTANTGISKITVAMTAKDQSVDYILAGGSFADPVFGKIKVAFNGVTKGTTDSIIVDNSGTTAATVKFTDYRGNEKTVTYAYTSSSSWAPAVNWTSTKAFHVLENDVVRKFDYVLLAPTQGSEFSHIMQYSSASNLGSSNAYVELTDLFTGDTTRVYLDASAYNTSTFYLDGQAYYVNTTDISVQTVKFSWGTGASVNSVGDTTMVYPLIKAKGGEWVTFATNVTLVNGSVYEFPTYTSTNISTQFNSSTMPYMTTTQLGRVNYTANSANSLVIAGATGVGISHPIVLVLEEKGKDTGSTEVQDAIIVKMSDPTSTAAIDLTIDAPILTAASSSSQSETTDNSVTWYVDRYGALVKYDTDGQGLVEITYPDQQAEAVVAVGSNPTFTTTTTGTTVETAIKITEPVSKLASEIDSTAIGYDLVLVGGPCVNTLVKELLGADSCTGWSYTTGIIKEVSGAFGTSHKALIVAGTSKEDTRSLAAKVMKGTLSFEA